MGHFVLLRHGETEINKWNKDNETNKKIGGHRESPLTPQGETDAIEAGKQIARMSWIDIQQVFSSVLERALRTTYLVIQQLPTGIPVIVVPEFREISYGLLFGGRMEKQVQKERPEFFEPPLKNWRGDFDQKAPGGQNYTDLDEVVRKGMETVLRGRTGDKLIVSHLHVFRVLLYRLFGLTKEETCRLTIPNTTPIVIEQGSPNRLVGDVTWEQLLP